MSDSVGQPAMTHVMSHSLGHETRYAELGSTEGITSSVTP